MNKRGRKPNNSQKIHDWVAKRDSEGKVLAKAAKKWTLDEILEELEVELDKDFDHLLAFLSFVRGRFTALDQLREGILESQDLTNWEPGDFLEARRLDRLPTLDEIIDWKKLNRVEVAGGLAAAAWMHGVDTGRAILGSKMPEIIIAAVNSAIDPDGGGVAHQDRKLLMEAGGLLPKGPNTVVNVNQQNNTQVVGLPQWGGVDEIVKKVYFKKDEKAEPRVEPKGLPEARLDNVVEGELVEEKTEATV